MKTAVIYARYSCDKQTEQSIEGQLRVCEDYARRNNMLIIDTYIDQAISGTTDNRAAFQKMIKDSVKKQFNYVLVYKLDRFSRDKYATVIHKKTLKDNGVKVISAMENIPDTPEGIILESLLEGMNQYYSAELSQKVKRGMKETRIKGYWQGGTLLYGYKLDGRRITIDEERAEHVRFVFLSFARGIYMRKIVKALNDKGIFHRNKPFTLSVIYHMLRNEKYKGIYRHGDELYTEMYPQIVDTDIFDKVQIMIKSNQYGGHSIKRDYLLLKKIKCGVCGENVNIESGKSANGIIKYYYKCRGNKMKLTNCKNKAIPKDILEKFVIDNIVKEMSKPKHMDYIVSRILEIQEEQCKIQPEISALLREQKEIKSTLANILSAIEKGIVSNTTNSRLQELEARQLEIEEQLIKEQSKTQTKITEQEIRRFYQKILGEEPHAIVSFFLKEVVLFEDRIEIHLNSPKGISPDESQGFSFCTKLCELGKKTIELMLKIT